MSISQEQLSERMEHFQQVCREAGVKLTQQRIEIFREVARSSDHPDAETVLRRVRQRLPTVSLDTVYRALWLLADLGLIGTLGPARERTRFDANLTRHHHFVCIRCGLTSDFYSEILDDLQLPDAVQALGEVAATRVEVRGVCRRCGAADAKKIR
jgi:Fur family peroxide stress response transcriptional regulator